MTDQYGRKITYLRLSVTDRCNLRCRYCMPENGICKKMHSDMLTEDEMILSVEAAASLGINKLRITGGEPLIKKNILSICERCVSTRGIDEVCLTTNGMLLSDMAHDLYKTGVKRLNISLDTLDSEKYKYLTRIGSLEQVLSGIEAALSAGFKQIKINTVLIGGFNDDEISSLSELTRIYPVDLRFIELMPMLANSEFGESAYVSSEAVLRRLPDITALGKTDGVAVMYQLPNAKGSIGLISSVSKHFCESCNRIRLTADGMLKPCLHSSEELSVKGLDFDMIRQQIIKAINMKPACHGPLSGTEYSKAGRNMNLIGG